jgi:hypothetical protein
MVVNESPEDQRTVSQKRNLRIVLVVLAIGVAWLIGFNCGVFWAKRQKPLAVVTHRSPDKGIMATRKTELPKNAQADGLEATDVVVTHNMSLGSGTLTRKTELPKNAQADGLEATDVVVTHEMSLGSGTLATKPEAPAKYLAECEEVAEPVEVHLEPVEVHEVSAGTGTATRKSEVPPKRANEHKEVTKLLFGVRLGETLTSLRSRVKITSSSYNFLDKDFPGQVWNVTSRDPGVRAVRVSSFDNRIYKIIVNFKDTSRTHFNTMKELLNQVYGSKNIGLARSLFDKESFETTIDSVPVSIELNRDIGFGEDDKLTLTYFYGPLLMQLTEEVDRRKTAPLKSKTNSD